MVLLCCHLRSTGRFHLGRCHLRSAGRFCLFPVTSTLHIVFLPTRFSLSPAGCGVWRDLLLHIRRLRADLLLHIRRLRSWRRVVCLNVAVSCAHAGVAPSSSMILSKRLGLAEDGFCSFSLLRPGAFSPVCAPPRGTPKRCVMRGCALSNSVFADGLSTPPPIESVHCFTSSLAFFGTHTHTRSQV